MVKIKYNGIKIKTDSVDEAIAILESLKVQPPYAPVYPTWRDPDTWMHKPQDWSIPYSGTITTDPPVINGDSLTVTSN